MLHTLPREPPVMSPTDHWGEGRTIKGKVSTCAVGAKMVTIEACQSSLGKESDWIRDIEPGKI